MCVPSELSRESFNDRTRRMMSRSQYVNSILAISGRPLTEQYLEGQLVIHLHFELVKGNGMFGYNDATKFCATYQWPWKNSGALIKGDTPSGLEAQHIVPALLDVKNLQTNVGNDKSWMAVLVDLPQFIQDGERLPPWVVWPCTKGLQPLELCPHGFYQLKGRSAGATPLAIAVRCDDRERHPSPGTLTRNRVRWRPAGIELKCELPNKAIQSRAEVVDDISHCHAPLQDGRSSLGFPENDHLLGVFEVGLQANRARLRIVHEAPHTLFQRVDLLLTSAEFCPRTVEGVDH